MAAQVLEIQGATAFAASHVLIGSDRLNELSLDEVDTVVIVYLNDTSVVPARHAVRRLKRRKPKLRVGLFVPLQRADDSTSITAEKTNADFVATTIADAVTAGLAKDKPVPLKLQPRRRPARRQAAPKRPPAKA